MGHPDKVADQISDAVLDSLLKHDPQARAAVETLVTTGLVLLAGEVTVHNGAALRALEAVEDTARQTIRAIGYDDPATGFDYRSCAVLRALHSQSSDISQGVTQGQGLHAEQGAGDQGMMFGYACDETRSFMPLPIHLSHRIVERLAKVRQEGVLDWLLPDSKCQVTIKYGGTAPASVHTVVVSTQHTEDVFDSSAGQLAATARKEIIDHVVRPVIEQEGRDLWSDDIKFHINPTGRFVIGGPHGDTGLTGRKIIVDTYGGMARHGGGAFSGKDPTKVDRSASYMARHIAKNIVAAHLARRCEVQLAYAIGVAKPVSVWVDHFCTGQVTQQEMIQLIRELFPLTPRGIIEYLKLERPIYTETARHGHFGREGDGFSWEKTDRVSDLQAAAKSIMIEV